MRKEGRFQQVEGGGEKIFRYLHATLFLLSLRGSSKISFFWCILPTNTGCCEGNFVRIRTGLIKLYHLPTADATLELRQRAVTFFVKRVYIHPIRNKAELSLIIHEQDCIAVLSIKQCNSPETIYDLAIFEWQHRDPRLGWEAQRPSHPTLFPSSRVFPGKTF